MDAFELGVLVVVAGAVLACCLAARASAGKPLSEFGRGRRTHPRPACGGARDDDEDLHQMLAVTNARRRARGLPERTVADALHEFGEE